MGLSSRTMGLPNPRNCVSHFLVSTTNWHLPRALSTTEKQRHLPSAMEIKPHAVIAVDLQQTLREFRVELRHSVLQGIWWDRSLDSLMFLGTDFMISILASPHI